MQMVHHSVGLGFGTLFVLGGAICYGAGCCMMLALCLYYEQHVWAKKLTAAHQRIALLENERNVLRRKQQEHKRQK